MVYNEGFDINLGKYSFFAFSKYERNNHENPDIDTRWVSKCYSTLVGWYHIGPKQWGCFVATKQGENPEEVTNGEPKGKLLVVANTVKKMDDSRKNRFKSVNKKEENNVKILGNGPISQYQVINGDESAILLDGMTNFIQTKETMYLSKDFKDHHIFVDRVKNLTDLWEATAYDEFSKMTLEELNKFAGRKKIGGVNIKKDIDMKKLFEKLHPEKGKVESAEMFKFRSIKRSAHRDAKYPQFPKNYLSNKKFMHPARNQVDLDVKKGILRFLLCNGDYRNARGSSKKANKQPNKGKTICPACT